MAKAQPTSDIGHNSAVITMSEEDEKVLYFGHLRKRMAIQAQIDKLNDEKKSAGQLAKADGIVLGDLDYGMKSLKAEDDSKVINRHAAHGKILYWLGLTSGYQSDLFKDRAPAIERITADGERAGFAGSDRNSGHPAGSDEDQAWLTGYDSGQKVMQDRLQEVMEKAQASRKTESGVKIVKSKKKTDADNDSEKESEEA